MPEGDTLYQIANKLRPVLAGEVIRAAAARRTRSGPLVDAESLVGRTIESVGAVGKHLLIALDDRRVIHSHLGMTGSWRVYALGAGWDKPARQAGLLLSTATHTVVNLNPKLLELTTQQRVSRDAYLRRLGPDLMRSETNLADILPRLRFHDLTPIGQAVMNQTVMAGVGNVYKSESLFLSQINPWLTVNQLSDEQLLAYLALTRELMHRNRGRGMRTTRFGGPGPRQWVYGRQGQPCLKCGAAIQMRRQGDSGRSTYWCPECQAVLADKPKG